MSIGRSLHTAVRAAPVTTAVAFPRCAALLVSADVTATVVMADGTSVASMPLKAGYNPLQCTMVTFATGTIHALYN